MYKDVEKRKEYQRHWQVKASLERKKKVVSLLGGKCTICGYNDNILALQLDHIIPIRRNKKDLNKRSGSTLYRNILLGKEDISNIRLLCANCHAIETYKQFHNMDS